MASKETPDLIICDIMMPVSDGYGLLHLINKNGAYRGHYYRIFDTDPQRFRNEKLIEAEAGYAKILNEKKLQSMLN